MLKGPSFPSFVASFADPFSSAEMDKSTGRSKKGC